MVLRLCIGQGVVNDSCHSHSAFAGPLLTKLNSSGLGSGRKKEWKSRRSQAQLCIYVVITKSFPREGAQMGIHICLSLAQYRCRDPRGTMALLRQSNISAQLLQFWRGRWVEETRTIV